MSLHAYVVFGLISLFVFFIAFMYSPRRSYCCGAIVTNRGWDKNKLYCSVCSEKVSNSYIDYTILRVVTLIAAVVIVIASFLL